MSRIFLEGDEYVYIAIWSEVVTQDRAEEGELMDLPFLAEFGDFFFWANISVLWSLHHLQIGLNALVDLFEYALPTTFNESFITIGTPYPKSIHIIY